MKYITPIAAGAALAIAAASAAAQNWDYTDGLTPENWSDSAKASAACDAGAMQSPIDLGEANTFGDITFAADYGPTEGTLHLGRHKVKVDAGPGQGMVSGNRLFNLLQVHFHTPSEHAFDGKRYPLTAHFVHATRDGALGVLGVMFEEGEANEGLQTIVDAIPNGDGSTIAIDMGSMMPDDLDVYRYMGSLTTPPCSENVNWHIFQDPVEASSEQIATFERLLELSARSIQPLNNRLLIAPSR